MFLAQLTPCCPVARKARKARYVLHLVRVLADENEPRSVLKRIEQPATERMALHHFYSNWPGSRPGQKERYVEPPSFSSDVDPGQTVETLGKALIDVDTLGTLRLDGVAEGSKAGLGQWLNSDRSHQT